jgi:hypothetical protein
MADEIVAANIAAAARRLNELRENWLNPPEWVERVPEEVPGFPDRIVPKPGHDRRTEKAHADQPLQPVARPGSTTPTRHSMQPSPPPTAGPTTHPKCPTKKSCAACWR